MSNYNIYNTDYQLLFPNNLKKYKNLKALALQIEKELKINYLSEIEKLAIFKNLSSQSNKVLSQLAWQFSIDNWQESLSKEIKINLIKNAYWAHSKKGTKKAVEDCLKMLGYPITLQEWFEYNGNPYTYKVIISGEAFQETWITELIELIEKYKNCRSILETATIEFNSKNSQYFLGNYKIIEMEKEFIGVHNDIEKYKDLKLGLFRIIEKEVSNV
ncbi:phage tail protein I [Fusobacterium mortiferum]|uniref:Phage tail protein I n=1 Tax=Fusobacterium mortiferum TaxID=850 RepID=A0A414PRD1_FUSMR|nr:phage tail protein I [Fusobacterium mortiferum]MCI6383324.1 phage tail protein I [Fusobacterium mortiferum]RHF71070.1 phage tail protein I [Fusobacterium mortiferum]